jgi:hypothetical protein
MVSVRPTKHELIELYLLHLFPFQSSLRCAEKQGIRLRIGRDRGMTPGMAETEISQYKTKEEDEC